jgi:hypothetical protein
MRQNNKWAECLAKDYEAREEDRPVEGHQWEEVPWAVCAPE